MVPDWFGSSTSFWSLPFIVLYKDTVSCLVSYRSVTKKTPGENSEFVRTFQILLSELTIIFGIDDNLFGELFT